VAEAGPTRDPIQPNDPDVPEPEVPPGEPPVPPGPGEPIPASEGTRLMDPRKLIPGLDTPGSLPNPFDPSEP